VATLLVELSQQALSNHSGLFVYSHSNLDKLGLFNGFVGEFGTVAHNHFNITPLNSFQFSSLDGRTISKRTRETYSSVCKADMAKKDTPPKTKPPGFPTRVVPAEGEN